LWEVFLTQPFAAVNGAFADEAPQPTRSASRARSSTSALSRQIETGNVLVFDNALLDQVFARHRAAANRQTEPNALNSSNDRKDMTAAAPSALLQRNDSFAAKITSRTPANLAAALRFAEQGRKLIRSREYRKAVDCFERAVSLGLRSYLPYTYYYLAQSHYHLANYQNSVNFLDAAESWLGGQSDWRASIALLRFENVNAMGYAHGAAIR
jgi:tetratricopeptide (TPR) repeat protein